MKSLQFQISIEGYHDVANKVLFLHLRSPYDAHHFQQIISKDVDDKKVLLKQNKFKFI